jgi:glutamate---cysteine ligase / carboxylate-amine ligase
MEEAFGTPFTVGIEEELFLVDPRTRRLAHEAERVLDRIELPPGAADHEAFSAEVELRSPPSATVGEAAASLGRARAAARAAGATLMGCGLHPTAEWGDVQLVEKERYRRVVADMRGLILRTPECALHVHVGLPDADTAIRVFNGLRAHLPLLSALAASSAFWFGRDSGLASARAALIRSYPGRGVPPVFRDLEEYERALRASAAGGGPTDPTMLWWDIRLHPTFGTVELREMDAQSRLDDVAAIAALIQSLARHQAERGRGDAVPSESIAWSAFRAGRDGLDAEILHRGALAPVREVAAAVLAELPADDALDGVRRILRDGGGADRQRAAARRAGMPGVLELIESETAEGVQDRA